jgi:hypothetical protein
VSGGEIEPLRQILHRALVRYLTVRAGGFELERSAPLARVLQARIVGYGAARTLYRERKPRCRSLDGVRAITEKGRLCAPCRLRSRCTPQVRLDLFVGREAYRLLLPYTSAERFLLYEAQLRQRGIRIEDALHRLEVVDRGSWGEVRFRLRE